MPLDNEQKTSFDKMNKCSYLFRLEIGRNGLDLSMKKLNGCEAFYVLYRNHVIGVVTFGEEYTNFTLYKYLKKLFPKLDDFRMADYFDDDHTHFMFEQFSEYVTGIKLAIDSLPGNQAIEGEPTFIESVEDVKARLIDFLVSDDFSDSFTDGDSLPLNILRHDISMALKEISRLEQEKKKRGEALLRVFLSV